MSDNPNLSSESDDKALTELSDKNGTDTSETPENEPPTLRSIFDWVETLVLYFSIAMAVILLLFTNSPVIGSSMYPTLENGDIIIVKKFANTPKTGDIIVCQSLSYGLETPLVKRVIAVGGQNVSIDYSEWTVTVDGKVLDEDYINYIPERKMNGSDYLPDTFTVPEGKLFVMGDNRNDSWDSRRESVGFIDERYVMGKVVLRVYPIRNLKLF